MKTEGPANNQFSGTAKTKGRVLVAMSGGVDSSVAAGLLVEQGYEVIGATLQVWDYTTCSVDEGHGTCCSSIDVEDARAVADRLNIPFYVLNVESQFKAAVIDPFIESYLQGNTPLPCVNCNTYLKFGHLIQKMEELGCDYLATGHYARIEADEKGRASIFTSADDFKDQTYFLFTIEPELVPRLIFPIGHLKKPAVRSEAERMGFETARKKDSTGICFVGNKGYDRFIEENVDAKQISKMAGTIRRYPLGEVMGRHTGFHRFTYGQGKGLGLDHHEKLFVLKTDPQTNTVWIGEEKYLYQSELRLRDLHLLHPDASSEIEGQSFDVKIRYSLKGARAKLLREGPHWKLQFEEPQRAVTPGQAAVLYQNQKLLGGGWILPAEDLHPIHAAPAEVHP